MLGPVRHWMDCVVCGSPLHVRMTWSGLARAGWFVLRKRLMSLASSRLSYWVRIMVSPESTPGSTGSLGITSGRSTYGWSPSFSVPIRSWPGYNSVTSSFGCVLSGINATM